MFTWLNMCCIALHCFLLLLVFPIYLVYKYFWYTSHVHQAYVARAKANAIGRLLTWELLNSCAPLGSLSVR